MPVNMPTFLSTNRIRKLIQRWQCQFLLCWQIWQHGYRGSTGRTWVWIQTGGACWQLWHWQQTTWTTDDEVIMMLTTSHWLSHESLVNKKISTFSGCSIVTAISCWNVIQLARRSQRQVHEMRSCYCCVKNVLLCFCLHSFTLITCFM
jgi:hypothetical protein